MLGVYSVENLEQTIRAVVEELDINTAILVNAIRTALPGQPVGPEFLDVPLVLGKQTVLKRLRDVGTFFDECPHI